MVHLMNLEVHADVEDVEAFREEFKLWNFHQLFQQMIGKCIRDTKIEVKEQYDVTAEPL